MRMKVSTFQGMTKLILTLREVQQYIVQITGEEWPGILSVEVAEQRAPRKYDNITAFYCEMGAGCNVYYKKTVDAIALFNGLLKYHKDFQEHKEKVVAKIFLNENNIPGPAQVMVCLKDKEDA